MTKSVGITATGLLASVRETLGSAGYQEIAPDPEGNWSSDRTRLFEDQYGVVGIVVFDTWAGLESGWAKEQESLVALMSRHFAAADAKAWDGYLVLLTPATIDPEARPVLSDIRSDTNRVRKFVSTGEELRSLADVESVLRPLLPLEPNDSVGGVTSILQALPGSARRQRRCP